MLRRPSQCSDIEHLVQSISDHPVNDLVSVVVEGERINRINFRRGVGAQHSNRSCDFLHRFRLAREMGGNVYAQSDDEIIAWIVIFEDCRGATPWIHEVENHVRSDPCGSMLEAESIAVDLASTFDVAYVLHDAVYRAAEDLAPGRGKMVHLNVVALVVLSRVIAVEDRPAITLARYDVVTVERRLRRKEFVSAHGAGIVFTEPFSNASTADNVPTASAYCGLG